MISSEYKSRAETVLMLFLPCFCLISMEIFYIAFLSFRLGFLLTIG